MCGVDLRFTLATPPLSHVTFGFPPPSNSQHVVWGMDTKLQQTAPLADERTKLARNGRSGRARGITKKVVVPRWRWWLSGVACTLEYLFRCNRVNDIQGVKEYDSLQFVSISMLFYRRWWNISPAKLLVGLINSQFLDLLIEERSDLSWKIILMEDLTKKFDWLIYSFFRSLCCLWKYLENNFDS